MPKQNKIGKLTVERAKAFYPEFSPVVVFGSQRIGAIYALRNGIDPKRIRLATMAGEILRGVKSESIVVVRTSPDIWRPPTFACERRVQETEQALKVFEQTGGIIENVVMA